MRKHDAEHTQPAREQRADRRRHPIPHLFSPFQIGPMRLRNRVMAPPHSSAIGNLWGTDEKEVERTFAYWRSRVSGDGPAWVGE